jgi:GWxTD domain-containing protein
MKSFHKKAHLLLVLFVWLAACRTSINIEQDPFFESFFEKTSLIMTKEETKIYEHIPDKESKEEFIQEFWEIRDPDPGTEENENKIEFERRIEYANRWFGWRNPYKGRLKPEEQKKYKGWATDRGKVYIILGPPDSLVYDGSALMTDGRRISSPEGRAEEIWSYWRFRIYVVFKRGSRGRWFISEPEPDLFTFLEASKLNLVEPGLKEEVKRRLTFAAEFKANHIWISIPVDRMNFKKSGEKLHSRIRIKVNIYHNHKKVGTIEETQSFDKTEEEILDRKHIQIRLPFEHGQKGEYLLDIIVEDLLALTYSKYRDYIRFKK